MTRVARQPRGQPTDHPAYRRPADAITTRGARRPGPTVTVATHPSAARAEPARSWGMDKPTTPTAHRTTETPGLRAYLAAVAGLNNALTDLARQARIPVHRPWRPAAR